MNIRRLFALLGVVALLLIVLGSLLTVTWVDNFHAITTQTLGEAVFNSWGPTLIIVGVLMFASMLGGVYIAQEDRE